MVARCPKSRIKQTRSTKPSFQKLAYTAQTTIHTAGGAESFSMPLSLGLLPLQHRDYGMQCNQSALAGSRRHTWSCNKFASIPYTLRSELTTETLGLEMPFCLRP